ncbi:hypothetical protein ATY75_12175 [Rhizobium sp. N122]|uniref:hypothetical protein n=1 Tax=Rhizobium sp. N122 TaxID=1764272 RepID=UPI000B5A6911|nr:hypothetical protein [Rhizobium sp. N122]OWV62573.1 hypothetical protein ATY75_12175 [Rhizobium sp. N122]
MAEPKQIGADIRAPVTEETYSIARATLLCEWERRGGGPYEETVSTVTIESNGDSFEAVRIDWISA